MGGVGLFLDRKMDAAYRWFMVNTEDLAALSHHQVVRYRTGRAGRHAVEWEEWKEGPLHIQKREADAPKLKNRARDTWKAGSILTLIPIGENTAEFGQGDYCGDGVFCAEDYYLEIALPAREQDIPLAAKSLQSGVPGCEQKKSL